MIARITLVSLGVLFASAGIPATALAQTTPSFVGVSTFQVKPGKRQQFEALQQEANAARQQAGVSARYAFRVLRGGSINEYVFFTPLDDGLASYDQPNAIRQEMGDAGADEWFAQLSECVDDVRFDTLRAREELSIPLSEGRASTLVRLRMVETRPGRGQDYERWVSDTWVPAMRAAGMNGVLHFQNAFGVGQRTWTRLTFYDSWAELEGHPVARHVGSDAFSEVLGNQDEMTHGPKVLILATLPNLNIFPGSR